jgi:type I restriction enzyme, S subunit
MSSGILLHNAPSHWCIQRLGQIFVERKTKVSDADFAPLSVTKSGIVPQMDHVAKSDDGENRKLVRAGDIVINSRSDRRGSSGISAFNGSVSLINIVLEPRHGYPPFLHHLIRSYAFQEEFYRFGHGIVADLWTTRYSELKSIRVALPDLATQKAIADLLDRETARIDQLIEKKQRLVELLEERDLSNIWMSVTGKVAFDGSSINSGFSWIGTIPGHWEAARIKNFARMESGHTPSRSNDAFWENTSIPWVSLADSAQLRLVDVITETRHKISEAGLAGSSARILPAGSVAFTRDATVGLAAILGQDMAVSQHLVAWICGPRLLPKYLLYVIYAMRGELNRLTWGATIKTIGLPDLLSLSCPLPPIEEQALIIQHLQEALDSSRELRVSLPRSIGRLREFRSSLITAAVTGQLDIEAWSKRETTDRRLEAIEELMERQPEPQAAAV